MPSEYDFLAPYSRSLRRTGRGLMIGGAFLAGIASTALIVALPLRPAANGNITAAGQSDKSASTARSNATRTDVAASSAPTGAKRTDQAAAQSAAGADMPAERAGDSAAASNEAKPTGTAAVVDRPRETAGLAGAATAPAAPSTAPAPMATAAVPMPEPRPAVANSGETPANADASDRASDRERSARMSADTPSMPQGEKVQTRSERQADRGEEPKPPTRSKTPAARANPEPSPANERTATVTTPASGQRSAARTERRALSNEEPRAASSETSGTATTLSERGASRNKRHAARSEDKPARPSSEAAPAVVAGSVRSGGTPPAEETEKPLGGLFGALFGGEAAHAERAQEEPARREATPRRTERSAKSFDRRPVREEHTYSASREDSPRPTQSRTRTRDDRDSAREFVDDNGVRHVILPRRWSERREPAPAPAFDEPFRPRRVILIRPADPDDDD